MDDLNDDATPATWIEELGELIEKKKAENELLRKLREAVIFPESNKNDTPGSELTTTTDI